MKDLVKKTRTGGHSLILQFKKEDETETPMIHTGNTPSLIHPSEMNIWKRQGEIWTLYVTSKINTEGVGTSHTRNKHSSLNIKFIVLSKQHLRLCWVFQKNSCLAMFAWFTSFWVKPQQKFEVRWIGMFDDAHLPWCVDWNNDSISMRPKDDFEGMSASFSHKIYFSHEDVSQGLHWNITLSCHL